MTMSSADFLDEWFETDVLKATKSASGIIGTFLGRALPDGVRAASSLHGGAGRRLPRLGLRQGRDRRRQRVDRRGGAELWRGDPLQCRCSQVLVRNGHATGVVLENAMRSRRARCVGLDPRRTFLQLLETDELPAEFVADIKRFKFRGSSGK